MNLRDYIKKAVEIIPEVENYLSIDALKVLRRRDRREPMRREKESMEEQVTNLISGRFLRQQRKLMRMLTEYTGRKTMLPPLDIIFESDEEEDEFYANLVILLTRAIREGIGLFAVDVSIGFDPTLVNQEAADFAKKYAFDLVKKIDQTTRDILQRAVSSFIETPGMTLRQLVDLLPFDEQRAFTIAVTETTRAYAQGQKIAARAMADEISGTTMIKIWHTNNDDRVCDICGPLEQEERLLDEPFYEPDAYTDGDPPAHVNCRCWLSIRTRIDK